MAGAAEGHIAQNEIFVLKVPEVDVQQEQPVEQQFRNVTVS